MAIVIAAVQQYVRAAASRGQRRRVRRSEKGWMGSTLNGYVVSGDEQTYQKKFRMSRASFNELAVKLESAGYLTTNMCHDKAMRIPTAFKLAACLYFLAHGCSVPVGADVAGIGESTLRGYLQRFALGVADLGSSGRST